ncbi:MAG TPA: GPR1/FUN34/YaaH family transporter [Spirillospora sp.]
MSREGVRERGEHAIWEDRTRVVLSPIAAPSILGLFGLAASFMMVGAWQADWYGNALTPLILWPFVLTFGGIAQFVAAIWSYRARDGVATAMHGAWGAFWLAFGLLFLLISIGAFPTVLTPVIGAENPGFAFWWVGLAVITGLGAIAALGQNLGMTAVLATLAVGAGFSAAGWFAPSEWSLNLGGWLFVVSAVLALYTAAAMMFEATFGRTILPLGKVRAPAENVPGHKAAPPLEYAEGQPGVKSGQ